MLLRVTWCTAALGSQQQADHPRGKVIDLEGPAWSRPGHGGAAVWFSWLPSTNTSRTPRAPRCRASSNANLLPLSPRPQHPEVTDLQDRVDTEFSGPVDDVYAQPVWHSAGVSTSATGGSSSGYRHGVSPLRSWAHGERTHPSRERLRPGQPVVGWVVRHGRQHRSGMPDLRRTPAKGPSPCRAAHQLACRARRARPGQGAVGRVVTELLRDGEPAVLHRWRVATVAPGDGVRTG